ncbi:MAG TPA: VWA domain-containing protein, partial [Gammaproteobacteria bacterium]|nr:VWA domain-containing protein [Gammaproteobacteria bacterium]
SVETLPPARYPPHPVRLWLHPAPPRPSGPADPGSDGPDPEAGGNTRKRKDKKRQAERTDSAEKEGGLLGMRMETILGWAEFLKINRASEEEEQDDEEAAQIADDMDQIAVTRDDERVASRVRFDLDLPSAAADDQPLGEGILLPEWDYKRSLLRPDYCCLQPMVAADAEPAELPDHLRKVARRLRNQFQALAPSRTWFRAQPDGSEVDLDAYERFIAQRAAGSAATDGRLYRDFRSGSRDLSCLLLADLSLSTDAWINNHARVIDVIRDTVYLFSEALSASGDRFGLYGFSSRRREHVRFNLLKGFDESYNGTVRGRIGALKPGFYTRMGAAVRHATRILADQGTSQRLLLILTDGKPNDLDQYEGRYGIEDTRMAVTEARHQGLRPFCVTIDDEGGDYLPHLFGNDGYVVIRKPAELPHQLPTLYAQLTA